MGVDFDHGRTRSQEEWNMSDLGYRFRTNSQIKDLPDLITELESENETFLVTDNPTHLDGTTKLENAVAIYVRKDPSKDIDDNSFLRMASDYLILPEEEQQEFLENIYIAAVSYWNPWGTELKKNNPETARALEFYANKMNSFGMTEQSATLASLLNISNKPNGFVYRERYGEYLKAMQFDEFLIPAAVSRRTFKKIAQLFENYTSTKQNMQ